MKLIAVDQEGDRDVERADQQPGGRRPEDPRRVEQRRVEPDRVARRPRARPSRPRTTGGSACRWRWRSPSRTARTITCQTWTTWVAVSAEQDEGEDHRDRLGRDQGPALGSWSAITPPNRPKTITGPNWATRDEAEPERVVGQLEDEPALGDLLHPRPDERDQLAAEEQAVVAMAEGAGAVEADRHRADRRRGCAVAAAGGVGRAAPARRRPRARRCGSRGGSRAALGLVDHRREPVRSSSRSDAIWRSTRARASSTIARRSAASVVVRNRVAVAGRGRPRPRAAGRSRRG